MSAKSRAATKRHSGSHRPKTQRNRAVGSAAAVQERPAPQERQKAKASTATNERPFDAELEARKPAKEGPSRASQLSRAGKQIVSLERTEGFRRYVRETYAEMKKINWPDQETTRNLTLVVIAVSTVLGILLGGIDFVLFRLFEAVS